MSDLLQRLNAGIDVANRRLLTLRTQQDIEVALVFREILVETRDEIERLGRELTEARDGIKEVMSDHADTLARLDEARTVLDFYGRLANWHSPSTGFVLQYDPEPSPIQSDRGAKARAFLTASDKSK